MAGLLDMLQDPDPATRQGLLQMGLALMQSKGNFLNSVGQAGSQGLLGAQGYRERQQRTQQQDQQAKLMQGQVQQMQRQQELEALPGQFYRAPSSPMMDATGGMATATEASNNASSPGGFDMTGYQQALMAKNPMLGLQLQAMTKKQEPQLHSYKPGEVVGTYEGGKFNQVLSVPDKATDDPFVRLLKSSGIDPASPQGRQLLGQRLAKESSHAPAAQAISYGSPVPFSLPGGGVGYVQPGNRPGAAPQMMTGPDGKPLQKPKEGENKDPTEFQAKAGLYFKSMNTASQVLDQHESTNAWRPGLAEAVVPGEGTAKTMVTSKERQSYVQAQRQWIDSINRVRSGANLPELEYQRAIKTFFPIYSEGEGIKQQKAAARKQEEQAMQAAAGRALPAEKAAPQSGSVLTYNPATGKLE
jgi:hypothetical protein